jgi:peptidoglycan/LPS O-acetylase OafA/YrhL
MVYFLFFLMLLTTRSWLLNVTVVAACLGAAHLNASGQVTNCLAFFYIGGLAAMARKAVAKATLRSAIEGIAWLAALAIPPLVLNLARGELDRIDFPLLLAYTPILLFCLSREIAVPPAAQKAIEAAGNMTYSSYLLHFPIQLVIVIGFAAAGLQIPLYDVTFFAVYLAAILLASYLTYRYFEAPAQNLLRDCLLRPTAVAPKAALGASK